MTGILERPQGADVPFSDPDAHAAPKRDKPLLLVVDDDEEILAYLRMLLANDFEVETHSSAIDIESRIEALQPSMLLLDYLMPGRDGMDLLRSLRANPVYDTMPIIMISALNMQDKRLAAYEAGADDFIGKPFSVPEMKAKIEVWSRMAQRSAALLRRSRHFEELALRDGMTGLFSRRYALELLDREVARHKRYGAPLSILVMDLDDFKTINDEFGHAAGDEALKYVAGVLETSLREHDVVARYGGDEFLVILPNTDIDQAALVCKKISGEELVCDLRDGVRQTLSLSIGAAAAEGAETTATGLIDAADMAMYSAKRSGKGRFFVPSKDTAYYRLLDEHNSKRRSMRDVVSRILGDFLRDRGDGAAGIARVRVELMLSLANLLALDLALSIEDRERIRNAIRLLPCLYANLDADARARLTQAEAYPDREWATVAANLERLGAGNLLKAEVDLLGHVFERYDGLGMPTGQTGDEIPSGARILSLLVGYVDLHEQHAPTPEDLDAFLAPLHAEAGRWYDPDLVARVARLVRERVNGVAAAPKGDLLLIETERVLRRLLQDRLIWDGYAVEAIAPAGDAAGLADAGGAAGEADGAGEVLAEAPPSARDRLENRPWTVALIDIDGPGGQALAERAIELMVPTVVLATSAEAERVAEAKAMGARAYVAKPISLERLLRLLAHATGGIHGEDAFESITP